MAPKSGLGMPDYVHRDQNWKKSDNALDGVKVDPGKLAKFAKIHRHSTHSVSRQLPPGTQLQTPGGKNERRFYDTDDSSIGDKSTAVSDLSLTREVVSAAQQLQFDADTAHEGDNQLASDEEWASDEDGDVEDELPDDPKAKRSPMKRKNTAQHGDRDLSVYRPTSGAGNKAPGYGFPYVKGDSYPTTTDGVPSVSDALYYDRQTAAFARNDKHSRLHTSASNPYAGQIPAQGSESSVTRTPDGLFSNAATAHMTKHDHDSTYKVPAKMPVRGVDRAIASYPASRQHLSHPVAQDVRPPVNGTGFTVAPPAADPAVLQQEHNELPHVPVYFERKDNRGEKLKNQKPKVDGQQRAVNAATAHHQEMLHRDSHGQPTNRMPEQTMTMTQNDDADSTTLDIAVPVLYQQEYKDIKSADFDKDPNLERSPPSNETLVKSLTAARSLSPSHQKRFFTSLSIAEWEEAGDWFLDHFSETVNNLRTARREKRKAAREFEDEVERRHSSVSKKRQVTAEALSEMKATGAQVLLGTPKKSKKTK
ncbi:hypothetical protein LTR62_003027 [Meristemomyces frigidus]|uniref:Extracellular mutant protein 11 C-terminal domain-containing protein n=1 Tax=Meristemomyces frigidus TaxID=1508187 RepID=A0AAN7TQT9_9PEZI|nr:hypothetical protein LTR62_003027 [Meristemomyces frigidus]